MSSRKTDTPLLRELRAHLKNTPKAKLRQEWAEIEAMGLQGPTVEEFMETNKFPQKRKQKRKKK